MNVKKLIINADDFGLTPGVSHGIIETYLNGLVTSTTALTVAPYFKHGMELARKLVPDMPIGVHLTLTLRGAHPVLPLDKVPSLVNGDGTFWSQGEFEEKVDPEEVYCEWDAQIVRFLETGVRPDHLDSHHNVHGRNNELLEIAVALGEKYHLPLRNAVRSEGAVGMLDMYGSVPTTDKMMSQFYDANVSLETLVQIFDDIVRDDGEFYELNTHPAFVDAPLQECTSYCAQRLREQTIMKSAEAAQAVRDHRIMLTNYAVFG